LLRFLPRGMSEPEPPGPPVTDDPVARSRAMSTTALRALPAPAEALLYLRNNGMRRSLVKLLSAYVLGRQRWYMTREDLTRYAGVPVEANGIEFRFARPEDLPSMAAFTRRIPAGTLRVWCSGVYYFFLALHEGCPVSYRCLSPLLHPGVVGFMRLRRDQIFMVDEFTVPAYRRRGITRQMAIAMTDGLLAHGFREVLGIHRIDNHDTIAAARAKGIPRIGTLTRTRLLWKTSFRFHPADPLTAASAVPARVLAGALGSPPA
jgi:hypothetical protein